MTVRVRASAALSSILASAAALLLLASPAAALSAFSNLYVFGDSIVDAGNTQSLLGAFGFPDPTPASAGYFDGRFSNGINPADVLNNAIEGTNSVESGLGGDNYAFGGARAGTDGDPVPDLGAQLGLFTSDHGGVADAGALYLLNIGGNDVRDITIGGLTGVARQAVIDNAVSAITTAISDLQAQGATNFLFSGVGDVGSIPEIQLLGAAAVAEGRLASLDMNAAIQAALPASVTFFDTIALTDAVNLNPASFGLPAGINLTNACITAGVADPSGAPTCNDYAFWDDVHPTTQVLQILGSELIAAVPEPGTALLLGLGLMGLGSSRRREA